MTILTNDTLIDRAAISDIVIAYATAVDTHDWDLLRSLFTEKVHFDFSSFDPASQGEVSADELVNRARLTANFDATQHISSNHRHQIDGDTAICVSYMLASHFLKRPDGAYHCTLSGYYTYQLERTGSGWKINRYALNVTGQSGDPRVFQWAGLY